MQNEALEKELRGRLHDYESPVDPEFTWQNVQEQIQPRRKRPGAIWWWLPGLLLVGAVAWYSWNNLGEAERPATETTIATTTDDGPLVPAEAGNPTAPIASEATPQPPLSKLATPPTTRSTTQSVSSVKAVPKQQRMVSNTISIAPAAQPTSTTTTNVITTTPEPVGTRKTEKLDLTISQLPLLVVTPLPTTFYDPALPPFSELKDPACPVFTKRNQPSWTIGLTGGIGLPQREILAPNPDNTGQRDRNLEVERPLETISAQFLVGFETGNGFSLRSGLGYQRINSLAEYTVDTVITTITTGISEIIINGPGDTTFITGLVERRTHTSGTSRYYNNLTTINLPILLGKTFRAGKWRFGVEAGPVLNLRTSGSARYQQPDNTFNTRAENEGLFRSRLTGLGWQGSLFTSFAIRPKLDVSLGVSGFRQQRGGFEIEGSATKTTYDTYGVQLGVKHRF
ncbi:MAG: hypothetical protein AAF840_09125 [Bacteroidota bacterium]